MSPNPVPPNPAKTALPVASWRASSAFKWARSSSDMGPNCSRLSSTSRLSSSMGALAGQGVEIKAPVWHARQGGAVLSRPGTPVCRHRRGSVLKPSGTSTGVPPNVVQLFQPSFL